jgi:hypothetical protein
MAIIVRNKSNVYGLTTDLNNLVAADLLESQTARAAELVLRTDLASEVSRATGVEGALASLTTDAKTNLVAAINEVDAHVDAEVVRATGVEGALATLTTTTKANLVAAINEVDADLVAEASTARAAELLLTGNLASEASTARAAELVLRTDLASEVSRATGVEGALVNLETTVKTNLVAAINSLKAGAATDLSALQALVDTINGSNTTAGSFRKAIADVIDLAPDALNTLKEIAAYIEVNPSNPVSAIQAYVEQTISDLKGTVTASNDTLAEIEANLNAEISARQLAVSTEVQDRIADVNAEETRAMAAELVLRTDLASEVSRATGVEGTLGSLTTTVKTNLVAAINSLVSATGTAVDTLTTDLAAEVLRATTAEGVLTTNLATEASTARAAEATELAARKAQAAIPALEMLTVAANKIVLTYAPQQGVAGIMNFATVRYIDTNGIAYDAPVSVDGTDTSGKTFIISVDVSGEWNGKLVAVQYVHADTSV